jgi:16S rRNA processing protein RimM
MAIPEFDPATLAIGTIGRPHGLVGDLTLRPHNLAGVAALEKVTRVLIDRGGVREECVVDWFRRTGPGWLFRLRGIDSREKAESLTNAVVRVERKWLPAVEPGEFFVEDLIGCAVITEAGQSLGRVASLLWNGAQDILVIPAAEEILIPVVPAFVRSVDVPGRLVTVDWTVEAEAADEGQRVTPAGPTKAARRAAAKARRATHAAGADTAAKVDGAAKDAAAEKARDA